MNKEEIYFAEYKGKTPTIEDFVELETKMYTKEQFKKHIVDLYNQLDKSNNKIEKIKEYLFSIKDEPDADMYKRLEEYEFYKHILSIIDGSDE